MGTSSQTWAEVVDAHASLVSRVVDTLGIRGDAAKDAYSEGCIALRKIAARYDQSKGNQFSTFARKVLVRHIIRWRKSTHMIAVPNSTASKVEGFRKNPEMKGPPTAETVATVGRAMAFKVGPLDSDPEVRGDNDPGRFAEAADDLAWLRKCILKIPPRARQVLIAHEGLGGVEPATLAEIAREMEEPLSTVESLYSLAVEELQHRADPRLESRD